MTDWFDIDFKEEREELADLEYAETPLITLEEEDSGEICTCSVDPAMCLIHNLEIQDEKD